MQKLASLLGIVVLAGCATSYQPVPEGYTGPTATVIDTIYVEDRTKAQMFALTDVDGNRIMNSFWASASASQGRGAALTAIATTRQVQAKPMKATLRASHATGAPIHEIASRIAGTFFTVEGVVEFDPKPDRRYEVRGELSKQRSSVWIQDVETGQPVTAKVVK